MNASHEDEEYRRWKHWDEAPPSRDQAERFAKDIRPASLTFGDRILEFGFGQGTFLDWARRRGYAVSGIDRNTLFVESAKQRGHVVAVGTGLSHLKLNGGEYAAIVAFDVLEHLTIEEIRQFLREARPLLRDQGIIIARIPNGISPFGLYYQHVDVTHVSILSHGRLEQIGQPLGYELAWVANAARGLWSGRKRFLPLKLLFAALRYLIELTIGYVYFGKRIPMDRAVCVALRKTLSGSRSGTDSFSLARTPDVNGSGIAT